MKMDLEKIKTYVKPFLPTGETAMLPTHLLALYCQQLIDHIEKSKLKKTKDIE